MADMSFTNVKDAIAEACNNIFNNNSISSINGSFKIDGNLYTDNLIVGTTNFNDIPANGGVKTNTLANKIDLGDLTPPPQPPLISAGGRKLYRHSSGMGTVIEFNDGVDRKVLVLDAQYRNRSVKMSSDTSTDLPLPNYCPNNIPDEEMSKEEIEANGMKEAWLGLIQEGDWRNSGLSYEEWESTPESRATTPEACESLTDADLNRLWWTDENTSKFNTDAWLTKANCDCATHCRSIKVNGTGCDIPNFQTLLRIFCEGVNIDALDPTLADNPQLGLSNWFDSWVLWSSSEFVSFNAWVVIYNGVCNFDGVYNGNGVCPVLELS